MKLSLLETLNFSVIKQIIKSWPDSYSMQDQQRVFLAAIKSGKEKEAFNYLNNIKTLEKVEQEIGDSPLPPGSFSGSFYMSGKPYNEKADLASRDLHAKIYAFEKMFDPFGDK